MGEPQGALYVADGDAWVPSELTRGPWDPGAQHGGAVAALVVRELERVEAPVPTRLARLTLELLRPVPLEPLLLDAQVVRPGARVGLLEAELRRAEDGERLALARALRIRTDEVDFPDPGDAEVPELPPRADAPQATLPGAPVAYHSHATEHRWPVLDFRSRGVPGVGDLIRSGAAFPGGAGTAGPRA